MFRLPADFTRPFYPQPLKIVEHLLFKQRGAALPVDVFNPQKARCPWLEWPGFDWLTRNRRAPDAGPHLGWGQSGKRVENRSTSGKNTCYDKNPKQPFAKTHIKNKEDLNKGLVALRELAPVFGPIIDRLPDVPLRLRAPGFEGLAEIITGQQVSKASAAAIFGRLKVLINPMSVENFLEHGDAPLIKAGLSRAKQSTLTGLAVAIDQGEMSLENLCQLPVDEAMERLTALKGIGPWTAEVFLLFCAGHTDTFPAGDVALQHAVGEVCNHSIKPDIKTTRRIAEAWSPARGSRCQGALCLLCAKPKSH